MRYWVRQDVHAAHGRPPDPGTEGHAPHADGDRGDFLRRRLPGRARSTGEKRHFDVATLEALRGESGSEEAKVFNLVRGLREEIEYDPDSAPLLRPLKDRASAF